MIVAILNVIEATDTVTSIDTDDPFADLDRRNVCF
jgi:hypothetical protein